MNILRLSRKNMRRNPKSKRWKVSRKEMRWKLNETKFGKSELTDRTYAYFEYILSRAIEFFQPCLFIFQPLEIFNYCESHPFSPPSYSRRIFHGIAASFSRHLFRSSHKKRAAPNKKSRRNFSCLFVSGEKNQRIFPGVFLRNEFLHIRGFSTAFPTIMRRYNTYTRVRSTPCINNSRSTFANERRASFSRVDVCSSSSSGYPGEALKGLKVCFKRASSNIYG